MFRPELTINWDSVPLKYLDYSVEDGYQWGTNSSDYVSRTEESVAIRQNSEQDYLNSWFTSLKDSDWSNVKNEQIEVPQLKENDVVKNDVKSISNNESSSILGIMKQNNKLLKNKNDLFEEQNSLSARLINETKEQNNTFKSLLGLMVESEKRNIKNDVKREVNDETKNFINAFSNDIAVAQNVISNEKNAKSNKLDDLKIEKLEAYIKGIPGVNDEDGNKISPMEDKIRMINAKLREFQQFLEMPVDTITDLIESENLSEFDPFEAINTILKEFSMQEIEAIKKVKGKL